MNGITWSIKCVNPENQMLIDRTKRRTVATTDPKTHTIYISKNLKGDFKRRVIIHELAHCAMISFKITEEIEKMVKKEYRIEVEEMICNFLADYGDMIYDIAHEILGKEALYVVPAYISKMIS